MKYFVSITTMDRKGYVWSSHCLEVTGDTFNKYSFGEKSVFTQSLGSSELTQITQAWTEEEKEAHPSMDEFEALARENFELTKKLEAFEVQKRGNPDKESNDEGYW